MQQHVRVGIGVAVYNDNNEVLIGVRTGSHGHDTYAFPGGHLEMFESWEQCAIREVKEETNLDITNLTFDYVTNDIMRNENKHYITIFMKASLRKDIKQNMKNLEPNKCKGWYWYKLNEIPQPRFVPLNNYIEAKVSK